MSIISFVCLKIGFRPELFNTNRRNNNNNNSKKQFNDSGENISRRRKKETRIEWRSIIEFSASFTIDWVLWTWTCSSTLIVSSRLSTVWLIEQGSGRTSRLVLFLVDARTDRSLPMMCPSIRRQKKKQQRKRDTLQQMCNDSIYAHLCVRYSHQIWIAMLDYPWPEHIHKCAHILITIIFIWISKNFLSQIVSPHNKYAKRTKKSYWTHSHDKRERQKSQDVWVEVNRYHRKPNEETNDDDEKESNYTSLCIGPPQFLSISYL